MKAGRDDRSIVILLERSEDISTAAIFIYFIVKRHQIIEIVPEQRARALPSYSKKKGATQMTQVKMSLFEIIQHVRMQRKFGTNCPPFVRQMILSLNKNGAYIEIKRLLSVSKEYIS